MQRYFIWNGVRSDTKHIIFNERVPIVRPEERVEHIVIPGRPGELTQAEGEDIFNSYIQTVPIAVDGLANVPAAEAWLKGDGYVTFDTQSSLKQRARIINAVTFQRHSKNANWYEGEIQFYCDPIKMPATDETITVTSSGTALSNPGTLPAFPMITITGSGAVSITIAGETLVIPSLTSGWVADCENQWLLQSGVPQMNAWTGKFPKIPVGNSTVAWTGNITKLVINPRWRTL